jgi:hypothetical protein
MDILFGTFRNPRDVAGLQHGFYDGASARLPEMLIGRDVSRPKRLPDDAGVPSLLAERAG